MIEFYNLPPEFEPRSQLLEEWLYGLVQHYGERLQLLQFNGLANEEIQKVNREFLNHDYPTDVITFNYTREGGLSGEVLMGTEAIRMNARERHLPFADEFCRVMAHAVLHLMGYDDQTDTQQKLMRQAEENCLILRPQKLLEPNF